MKTLLLITCLFCLPSFPTLGQDELKVALKEDAQPDLYIDGKQYDHAIFDLLDQSKIESVQVVKGEQALKEYNAPNGVVLVKTKVAAKAATSLGEQDAGEKEPLIILDGEVSDKATIAKLNPDDIATIEVIKDQKAIELYNAPNGVVVIKTKKAQGD